MNRDSPITENEIGLIKSVFLPKRMEKGAFFLRPGEKMRYGAFVAKGFLRSYTIDEKGKDILCSLHLRTGGREVNPVGDDQYRK